MLRRGMLEVLSIIRYYYILLSYYILSNNSKVLPVHCKIQQVEKFLALCVQEQVRIA